MCAAEVRPLRTVSIVGARPQFVKLAPVSRAMREARRRIDDQVIHTGQHYDANMSRVFFEELQLPEPRVNLGVGSGPQGWQVGRMLEAIEAYLLKEPPDLVLVYGDTNSTVAGALAAAKLHVPVVHVEAGLRSFNRCMPEELNRTVADHLSALLCAPTATAMANLAAEGLEPRARLTGDVMYDALLYTARRARERAVLPQLRLAPGEYGVATLHRAESTTPAELDILLQALNRAAEHYGRIVFPMHPRTAAALGTAGSWRPTRNLLVIEPLPYGDMLALLQGARWVLTDSGGLQKEAYFLECPCVTLRDETEWPETLAGGANHIAGRDGARLEQILSELAARPRSLPRELRAQPGPFGAGDAAARIVAAICELCEPET